MVRFIFLLNEQWSESMSAVSTINVHLQNPVFEFSSRNLLFLQSIIVSRVPSHYDLICLHACLASSQLRHVVSVATLP